MTSRSRRRCEKLKLKLRWHGCSRRTETEHVHERYNVLVYFRDVAAFAFVLTSIGLEQKGHEVLAVALVVNLAVGNDIFGELSDRVGNRALGLNGLEREGGDPREQPQNEQGREGGVFTAHVTLSPEGVDDLDSIRSVTDSIEVVAESYTANDVQGGAGGIVEDVDLEGRLSGSMDLVLNAGLEGATDVIDVGVHRTDVLGRKGGGDETTHALMLLFTFDPDERATADADDEGTEDGRVMVIVRVLCEDVGEPNCITHNQLYKQME